MTATYAYELQRIGVVPLTSSQTRQQKTKFVLESMTVFATSVAEARQLAAEPRVLQPGERVMPNNTIEPNPPYAWCVDEAPAAWLDPKQTTCRRRTGSKVIGRPSARGWSSFAEVPRAPQGEPAAAQGKILPEPTCTDTTCCCPDECQSEKPHDTDD